MIKVLKLIQFYHKHMPKTLDYATKCKNMMTFDRKLKDIHDQKEP